MSASPIAIANSEMYLQQGLLARVWAVASVASAASVARQRRGPHCLRLVGASEARPLPSPRIQRTIEPGLAFYRKYTEALLQRYMKMSMEKGRVPSLLGRELFRGNVTSCKVHAFDDVVIFVHDVSSCLEQLDPGLRHLVRRIALEEYTHPETAAMLGIGLRTVTRRYGEAIDKLTRLLLDRKLMEPMMAGQDLN